MSTPTVLTVLDSFRQPLPLLPLEPVPGGYRNTHAGGESTVATEPPKAFQPQPSQDLVNVALNKLPPGNAESINRLRETVPVTEATHYLRNEADVCRASFLYFLHPINIAVTQLLSVGRVNGRLECTCEMVGERSRTDIAWRFRPDTGSTGYIIAILELKNHGVVHWRDFEPAVADAKTASDKIESAMGSPTSTLLRGNAVTLSKQVKKYADTYKVMDVAIFDWNALFIYDFDGMNEDASTPILARGTFFTEADNKNDPRKGFTFRMLLYGFLVRALTRNRIIK
ncbi:MAG: hypothetical protein M1816_002562 [Peltula sp. TS41687]|nr:MAG: hypothetical protein M1816_002562 [Peltula sp. TS41687]